MLKLVLASQSPRRRDLLEKAGYEFRVSLVKVSEIFDENLNPEFVASHLATIKAQAARDTDNSLKQEGFLVLGADTIVVSGVQILGKPENPQQAVQFLRQLSGGAHRVMTGLALLKSGPRPELWSGTEITQVQFRTLSDVEIQDYVNTGEPMDKAGAYAIQGGAKDFVSSISGSWSNVVGLPLELLQKILLEKGWSVDRLTS